MTRKIIDTDATFQAAQRGAAFYRAAGLVTGELVIEESGCGTFWAIIEIR
jgi:hypothetical protein